MNWDFDWDFDWDIGFKWTLYTSTYQYIVSYYVLVCTRVPVQVGVNVPASWKKERSESVRVAGRPAGPPSRRGPGPLHYVQIQLRDCKCVSIFFAIIRTDLPRTGKTKDCGTQVRAIAVVSLIPSEILFFSHFIHPHSSWSRSPTFIPL